MSSLPFGQRLASYFLPCALGFLPLALCAAEPAPVIPPAAHASVDALLARADLAAYRGWLKFLRFEAVSAAARHGPDSALAKEKAQRLAEWADRIAADPQVIRKLSGAQEWAYESAADGSGQPFKVAIPSDYDPTRPAAMSVYMHGWSGNHLEHSTGMTSQPGVFQVAVLGRGRGGGYRCLSEDDVLNVIDYLQAHWAVDPDRIHLNGGSMGGGGTYRLGSRYPHRWASGRPTCGYASFVPIENLLTFPVYATHSADDPVVSALHDRGPLARLRELGGQVIYDETNGLGHAAWDYREGNARGDAWQKLQVRPASTTVRRVRYTAVDGGATRAWWGEIVEWGDAPEPARFALTLGANNTVFAELANVNRLRVRVAEAAIDRGAPLQVVVNGGLPVIHPAPLPEQVVLVRDGARWTFEQSAPALPFRLHTPGSAQLLYQGEPLLIVYGTRGTDAERQAMRTAAEAASKSSNPSWLTDDGEASPDDGVPHLHNLYGRLNVKADSDVTDADIARCHLVLIGQAAQNAVVDRIAAQMPVRFADGKLVCSDGQAFDASGRAWGLVHYNPLAPHRLVFWVGASTPSGYAPGPGIAAVMGGGIGLVNGVFGGDFLIGDAMQPTIVATRSFTSRWHWAGERNSSPLLPESLQTYAALTRAVGVAVREAAGADFAFMSPLAAGNLKAIVPGTTRICDLAPLFYFAPVGILEVTGTELLAMIKGAGTGPEAQLVFCGPAVDGADIVPARTYRVALPGDAPGAIARVLHTAPGTYRQISLSVSDAIVRFIASK